MSHLNVWIFHQFSYGNTVWPQASAFQKLAKWTFVHLKCKHSSLRSQCWMRHFMVIFKHCVLAFLKMQFCKVFPRKINYFIFVRWTYGASKGAVHTLTKMMALDLSKDKIRVNSLSPTWTWTPEVAKIDPQSNFSQFNLKSRVCGGRSYNSWQFFTSHNSQCLKNPSKVSSYILIFDRDYFLKHIWEIKIFKKK